MRASLVLVLLAASFPGAASEPDLTWKDLGGFLAPVPPPEHPRLYLRARDIPDLIQRTSHPALAAAWAKLQELAPRSAQRRVELAALRFLIDKEPGPARLAVAEALETLQKANYDPKVSDISRAIGRMMVTGAIVYDWCYPLLTDEQKQAFLAEFLRLAKLLECGYPPVNGGYVTGHTSEFMIMRDLLSTAIAVYGEHPQMYEIVAHRIFTGFLPVREFWYAGQAFHQGAFYCDIRWAADMYPLWIFDRMGAGNIFPPGQQFVPYEWIYRRRPDRQFLRAGDGYYKIPRLGMLLAASYYNDGFVWAEYLKDPYVDDESRIFEFLWRDPALAPSDPAALPLSRFFGFPYGWMIARTGWDSNSVMAEMKINVYNFVNHQHQDGGAFQIYFNGPLAIDSGLYQGSTGGYASPHHVNYHKRTIAHNSLLIHDPAEQFSAWKLPTRNDGGQRLPNRWYEADSLDILLNRDFKTGEILAYAIGPDPVTPEFSYLKGDITEAYSSKVSQVRRSFVFLNLNDSAIPAAFVVFDRIVSANPDFKKHWLLHSMEEPAIDGNSFTVTLSERGWSGKLVNTALLPESGNAEISKVGGPGKEFWVFGENFPNNVTGTNVNDHENGAWRIEISPSAPSGVDHFLNVMQITTTAVHKTHPVAPIRTAELAGAQLADRVVLFSLSGEPIGHAVSFSTSGESPLHYFVADLAPGNWQVTCNSRVIHPALLVTGHSGAIFFDAPAGACSIRR